MSEKENPKVDKQELRPQTSRAIKQVKRYTGENKKVTAKLNETETGPRRTRGKKQRRQFKLAPNRG
ncbi:MAG: hypothetical protein ABSA75_07565 [Candidatus Bathyarchaeia archaeon]|jgi:hypothetical protein